MADLVITTANVLADSDAILGEGTAGAAVTAGQALYKDATDLDAKNKPKLKPAIHTSQAAAEFAGIALHGAADEQPIEYLKSGLITIGATTAKGEPYYVSGNAGGICPDADIGTGDYVSLIGVAISTTKIQVDPIVTGVTHA